jgi:hypothetical protein
MKTQYSFAYWLSNMTFSSKGDVNFPGSDFDGTLRAESFLEEILATQLALLRANLYGRCRQGDLPAGTL